jgi:hypothetical protein
MASARGLRCRGTKRRRRPGGRRDFRSPCVAWKPAKRRQERIANRVFRTEALSRASFGTNCRAETSACLAPPRPAEHPKGATVSIRKRCRTRWPDLSTIGWGEQGLFIAKFPGLRLILYLRCERLWIACDYICVRRRSSPGIAASDTPTARIRIAPYAAAAPRSPCRMAWSICIEIGRFE